MTTGFPTDDRDELNDNPTIRTHTMNEDDQAPAGAGAITRDDWQRLLDTVSPVGKPISDCTADDLRRCIELLRAEEAQLLREELLREAPGDA